MAIKKQEKRTDVYDVNISINARAFKAAKEDLVFPQGFGPF
ncbi:hypothetical protein ACFL0B_06215 [Thermodesulfobacteriota bacterium]